VGRGKKESVGTTNLRARFSRMDRERNITRAESNTGKKFLKRGIILKNVTVKEEFQGKKSAEKFLISGEKKLAEHNKAVRDSKNKPLDKFK